MVVYLQALYRLTVTGAAEEIRAAIEHEVLALLWRLADRARTVKELSKGEGNTTVMITEHVLKGLWAIRLLRRCLSPIEGDAVEHTKMPAHRLRVTGRATVGALDDIAQAGEPTDGEREDDVRVVGARDSGLIGDEKAIGRRARVAPPSKLPVLLLVCHLAVKERAVEYLVREIFDLGRTADESDGLHAGEESDHVGHHVHHEGCGEPIERGTVEGTVGSGVSGKVDDLMSNVPPLDGAPNEMDGLVQGRLDLKLLEQKMLELGGHRRGEEAYDRMWEGEEELEANLICRTPTDVLDRAVCLV